MEPSITHVFVGITTLTTTVALYLAAIKPRLRAARLEPFRDALASAKRQQPVRLRSELQDGVLDALRGIEQAGALADAAEQKARAIQIPTPPALGNDAPAEDHLKELASFLMDPRVGLAVAGGEQLVGHLFAMAVPGAAGMLADVAMHGFWTSASAAMSTSSVLMEVGKAVLHASLEGGGVHAKEVALSVAEHILHEAIEGTAGEVLEKVGDAFDLGAADGAHFPVVTALLSSYREIRLLRQDKTSVERAVGHVVLDTGATAAGGFAGAKAGAAVGTLIAPGVGTAVGGLVGAMLGGVGGKLFASSVKEQPLKEAVSAYSAAAQAADAVMTSSSHALLAEVRQKARAVQVDYQHGLQPAPRLQDLPVSRDVTTRTLELKDALAEHLRVLAAENHASLRRAQELIPQASGIVRMFGLDVTVEAMQALSAARAAFEGEAGIPSPSTLPATSRTKADPLAAGRWLATATWPEGHAVGPQFRALERSLREATDELMRSLGTWAGQSAQSYRTAVAKLTVCLENEVDRHLAVVSAQRDGLVEKRDVVAKQRAALGR